MTSPKRFDVIMIYDELLPLKTPAKATSCFGVPIYSKSNVFVAFCAKSDFQYKRFSFYALGPIHVGEGNGCISFNFYCTNPGMANLFKWWVKFKVVDRKNKKGVTNVKKERLSRLQMSNFPPKIG